MCMVDVETVGHDSRGFSAWYRGIRMSLYMICTENTLSPLPWDRGPLRLVVRTLPFRGRNTGSTPVGDTDPHALW